MLEKVRHTWIKGLLEPSLDQVVRIELGLTSQPEAVERPFDLLVQRPAQPPHLIPTGTPLREVFDGAGKALLILGAPGAGKTMLLLELTRDLLDQAEQNENYLIPVVFTLSSWVERQSGLADWLVDELNQRYDIPRKLAKSWVESELVLPLLDGLDEVAPAHREACVTAINTFINHHGLLPMVVCSRVADYEALSTRLRLPSAVIIQPLTLQQVQRHLARAGELLTGLCTALKEDQVLGELLDTPLMLSIATLAYQRRPAADIPIAGTLEEQRTNLFAKYTCAMFERRSSVAPYTPKQTMHWLSWLAAVMARQNQSVFYLEWMQPNWLPMRAQQKVVDLGTAITSGLVGGLVVMLVSELYFGLYCGLLSRATEGKIRPVEALRWSWSHARHGLVVGPVAMLVSGLVSDKITTRTVPNEGIRRSIRSALVVGLVSGLLVGLVSGLLVGLYRGLEKGGHACLQHLSLRFLLWSNDFAPWHYVRFLDYAAERIFLRKVGGGYIFVHRMLLEYFAKMDTS